MTITECRCPQCEADYEDDRDDVDDETFFRSIAFFFEGVPDENLS
jgi:hypothetical protein